MYRQRPALSAIRSATGGIFLIGMAIAFFSGHFLPVLFITLAVTSLLGTLSYNRPNALYGGLHSFVWMLGLAFCFLFGFWPWILVVSGVSVILGALRVPIMAGILGLGFMGASTLANQQPYQPDQPYQPTQQQPYQQGYQPRESYQEGEQQYPYPGQNQQQPYQQPAQPEYEQTKAQYPQELPPQELG